MELITAIYTTDIGYSPERIGWWMIWHLRVCLVAMPLLFAYLTVINRRIKK